MNFGIKWIKDLRLIFVIAILAFLPAFQNCSFLSHPFEASRGESQSASGENAGLILHSNSFWDVDGENYPSAVKVEVERALAEMPENLKSRDLSPPDRALQLQWAFKAINENSAPRITLEVAGGDYDFSLVGMHVNTPDPVADTRHEKLYLPKLFLGRDNVAIVAASGAKPRFFYQGPGADGIHHGRVILFLRSGLKGILLRGLAFEGDHDPSQRENSSFYIHENNANLVANEYQNSYQYGLLMLGYSGGPNDVKVDSCSFTKIAFTGISVVGSAEITNSRFSGVMGEPSDDQYIDRIHATEAQLGDEMGFVGMTWGSGILLVREYGPVVVTDSQFDHVTEGIVGIGAGPGSRIERNEFSVIADHAIYILVADLRGASVSFNRFHKTFGPAVKFTGHALGGEDPLNDGTTNSAMTIERNEFWLARQNVLAVSGLFNLIRDNVVHDYTSAQDPSGYYNPARNPQENFPDIWLSQFAGGTGFYSHAAMNRVENNRVAEGSRPFTILLAQEEDVQNENDRSLSFNAFDGAGQKIFYKSNLKSAYAPVLWTGSSALVFGTPSDCGSCQRGDYAYRRSLDVEWSLRLRAGAGFSYLVKYAGDINIYLITESGRHRRVNPADRAYEILAVTDLNGDGYDEIYSREVNTSTIYGSQAYIPGSSSVVALKQWTFYDGGKTLAASSFRSGGSGVRGAFYAVFAEDPSTIWKNGPRSDGLVDALNAVYASNTNASQMPATDALPQISWSEFSASAKAIMTKLFSAARANGSN